MQQITKKRKRLIPFIEYIFLGHQNIPLRGHRDDCPLFEGDNNSDVNEGNFQELLHFKLENHLRTTLSRTMYISKNIQNELIECCSEEISSKIINNVKESGVYSTIFVETTDIRHQSQ